MITLNDFKKIEMWLRGRSVKDTSFPVATSMDSTDFVPVVKNNRNYIITFYNFIKSLGILDSINAVLNKLIGNPRGIAPLDENSKVPKENLPNFMEMGDVPQRIVTNVQKVKGVPFGFKVMTDVYMNNSWVSTSGNEYTIPYASVHQGGLLSQDDFIKFSDPISSITFTDDGEGLYISIETSGAYEHEAFLPNATLNTAGVMSAEDKQLLNHCNLEIDRKVNQIRVYNVPDKDGVTTPNVLKYSYSSNEDTANLEFPVASDINTGALTNNDYKLFKSAINEIISYHEYDNVYLDMYTCDGKNIEVPFSIANAENAGMMSSDDKTFIDSLREALTLSQGYFITDMSGRVTQDGYDFIYTTNNSGYWDDPRPNYTTRLSIPLATDTTLGLMSKEDKANLDSISPIVKSLDKVMTSVQGTVITKFSTPYFISTGICLPYTQGRLDHYSDLPQGQLSIEIPYATETEGGLITAEMFKKINGLESRVAELASRLNVTE